MKLFPFFKSSAQPKTRWQKLDATLAWMLIAATVTLPVVVYKMGNSEPAATQGVKPGIK